MIEQRYREVLKRIQTARERSPYRQDVTLIAVSKGQPAHAIEELYSLGHRDFGENYVQELVQKAAELDSKGCVGVRWHFIGHLQTNKIKALVPWVHSVHSIDSDRLAEALAKRWSESGRAGQLDVFLEVNVDQESGKSGVAPGEAAALSGAVASLRELRLQGLMCIPAAGASADAREGVAGESPFARLRQLEAQCRPQTHGQLSMGMSGDFEAAVAQGATHVRVGTAIFGSRG